jgi:crossover junction endodeoxyribonuclease RuvC
MRVVGIDPGSAVTGFGIIDFIDGRMHHVAAGTIRTARNSSGAERLRELYLALLDLIDRHRPYALSLERGFVALNVQSAFRLGEARAMAMLAARERQVELYEYTPTEIKMAVAGFGHADKTLVKTMVRRTLGLDSSHALADDASDALAIAACHLLRGRFGAAVAGSAKGSRVRRLALPR